MDITEIFLTTDQPTTCPKCGARTDFHYFTTEEKTLEQHQCLNTSCQFEFIGEAEETL